MEEPSPQQISSPGFQSLSRAGIHLTQGEALPEGHGNLRSAEWIEASNQQAEWPPLPTLAAQEQQNGEVPAADHPSARPSRVHVQPRGLRRTPGSAPAGRAPLGTVVRTPPLQFTCPCCGAVLSITDPASYRGQPGPCPHCHVVILPPRMVSPYTLTELPDSEHGDFA